MISHSAPLGPRIMRIATAPASVTTFSNCSTFAIVASPSDLCCAGTRSSSKPHRQILLPDPDGGFRLSFQDASPSWGVTNFGGIGGGKGWRCNRRATLGLFQAKPKIGNGGVQQCGSR